MKLSVIDAEGILVLAAAQGRREYALTVAPGQRMPIHAGAASKLLLAHLPPERARLLAGEAADGLYAARRSPIRKRLRAELARIRRQGWAQDKGENAPSIHAFAAPVLGRGGRMVAAVSVPVPRRHPAEPHGGDPPGRDRHRPRPHGRDAGLTHMRITDLKCAVIGQSPIVRIVTDAGLSGYGQAETWKPYLKPHILAFREALIGEDPRLVERVMRRIRQRGGFKPWGTAVSVIEMALWDLAGKAAGVPVHRLLGGKVRDRVRVYNGAVRFPLAGHAPQHYADDLRP